jgi:hypothetical protein
VDAARRGARRGLDGGQMGCPTGSKRGPDGVLDEVQTGGQMECPMGAMSSAMSFLNAMSFV